MSLDPSSRGQPSRPRDHDKRDDRTDPQEPCEREALIEQARQLGATAEELGSALDALALQAEAVLHKLRGGRLH
ncbi:MAG: hypothetical protein ABW190_13810 [Rhizobacter sp.]